MYRFLYVQNINGTFGVYSHTYKTYSTSKYILLRSLLLCFESDTISDYIKPLYNKYIVPKTSEYTIFGIHIYVYSHMCTRYTARDCNKRPTVRCVAEVRQQLPYVFFKNAIWEWKNVTRKNRTNYALEWDVDTKHFVV